MSIQPINLPDLLRAITWPGIAVAAAVLFRKPMANLIAVLAPRVNKVSVGGFSLEMARVQEMRPQAMDAEIRQLEAGLIPQSGSNSLTALINELQSGGQHDYVDIDFGSEASPRWLTSRLYLLCFLITLINRQLCLVFVETAGGVRKKLLGLSSPERVRWALARRYSWLESAGAGSYAMQAGLSWGNLAAAGYPGFLLNTLANDWFDPTTGSLLAVLPSLIQQFLFFLRVQQAPPDFGTPNSEWVSLDNQRTYEHAKWLNGARIESLLGNGLSNAHVTLMPNQTLNDLANPVLAQQGRFVAVTGPDNTFLSVIDRHEVLEAMAQELARQNRVS